MRALVVLVFACSSEQVTPPPAPLPSTPPSNVDDAPPARASADAPLDVMSELRARGYDEAARVIEVRVAQRKPKMKLAEEQGLAAAAAIVELDRESLRELHAVMPRSTVELARAVRERGVSIEDADTIARYLVRVASVLSFERLATFDENHSHVTGRDWPDIDYTGEGMTWQGQRADWHPKGVIDFKRARHIHAYFVGAERLPHWKRVYRPRGVMRDVEAPDD